MGDLCAFIILRIFWHDVDFRGKNFFLQAVSEEAGARRSEAEVGGSETSSGDSERNRPRACRKTFFPRKSSSYQDATDKMET